jgi:protein-L-isoaspartate O-methyltransferase
MADNVEELTDAKWEDEKGRARHTQPDATLTELEKNNEDKAENAERTQIKNTVRTYEKLAEWIDEGDRVLDYGGGLGYGTEALRKIGHNIDLLEPFSSEKRVVAPDYTDPDGRDVDGTYDKIISSSVLNVVPQDIRTRLI